MSDPVISVLLDIKEDVGEVKASLRALNAWMEQHAREDREAHERITKLEMRAAAQRGRASVWHIIATGTGALLGFVAQSIVTWFTSRP